jgi:hypothetical protein
VGTGASPVQPSAASRSLCKAAMPMWSGYSCPQCPHLIQPRGSISAMRPRVMICAVPLLCLSTFAQQPAQPAAPARPTIPTTGFAGLDQYRASRIAVFTDDFGQLARYHDANATLKPPAPGENRVVFFGDSITDIWHLDEYFPGKPYLNRGIGGQTTPQMLVRFRQDVINLQPKVVVILAGISPPPATSASCSRRCCPSTTTRTDRKISSPNAPRRRFSN